MNKFNNTAMQGPNVGFYDWTRRSFGGNGRAFDAATGPSGFAFLQSSLELIQPKLVEPLQNTTYQRDITVDSGGGFVESISHWALNYASTGGNAYGLQGTNNTDIPLVQVDVEKGNWKAFPWTQGMLVTYIDLQKMESARRYGQAPPVSLQELYEKAVRSVWWKALDRVTYLGWLGLPGLIDNNSGANAVAQTTAATVESATTWAAKMALTDGKGPQYILNDINTGLTTTLNNSGYNVQDGMADTLLLPTAQFSLLTNMMTIGGVAGNESILSYVKKNSFYAQATGRELNIYPLPPQWIAGQGNSGTDRAVFYRNTADDVYLKIPQPMQMAMTAPATRVGPGYETVWAGCIGQTIWLRSTTALYMDGI